jgi:hypothetical protein
MTDRRGLASRAAFALSLLLLLFCAADARAQDAERVFSGSVGRYPVRMTLRRAPSGELSGAYSYEGRTGSLALKGKVNEKGELTLNEYDGLKQTGTFKGIWREKEYEPEARIEGDWTRPGGGGGQPFTLYEELVSGARVTEKRIREGGRALRYEIEAAYPQVEGAATFNRLVEDFVRKEVVDFKRRPDSSSGGGEPLNSLNVGYSMRLATDQLVSVQFTTSLFEQGMPHPQYSMRTFNYDLKAGRQLGLADLFKPGSNYLQAISAAAVAGLEKINGEDEGGGMFLSMPEERAGAAPKAENYRNWTLTARGLAVTFEPYQVGPFAAGAPAVLIPYGELRDLIRPGGPLSSVLK